jgi:pimeloyl-ACP methyl ester carboxylesterase
VLTRTLSIHYTDSAQADAKGTVILVHGWPDAARGWDVLREGLVTAGWRVIVPDLRGHGATRFLETTRVRDGSGVALAQDVVDLADALALGPVAVVGHDWGARAAYTLGALFPERLTCLVAMALGFQPRGEFRMPSFPQARRFWYQWLMFVDAGAEAIRRDPAGFAHEQWKTWSPPGWYDEDEFEATAAAFANPDWVEVTLHAYRSRFLTTEASDRQYDELRNRLAGAERVVVPTLMIQGADDRCDPPELSAGLDPYFDSYHREVLDAVGHFPHREASREVTTLVLHHLRESERIENPLAAR